MVKLAAVSTWTFLNLLLSSIGASDLSHLLYNFDFEVLQGNELRGGITPWRGQNVFLGESHQGREVFMPMVGLGTWQWSNQRAYRGVQMALKVGYRHIDTAMTYKNQAGIGRAIRDSSVPRTDIFITSKVPVRSPRFDLVIMLIRDDFLVNLHRADLTLSTPLLLHIWR